MGVNLGADMDTIAAVSTPIGEGGIGIVRLSGDNALKIADRIFMSKGGGKPSRFKTYTVHYGHIIEKDTRTQRHKDTRIIDEVILTVMRSPRSYTKEDVVEINCHSGIVPLKKILDLVLKSGARLAQPGEFTKRAFLNGRIDLSQAEAVLDIIRAKTDLSLGAALDNLEGLFSKKVKDLRDSLMDIYANLEACIDFSEEDAGISGKQKLFRRLRAIGKDIEKLIKNSNQGRILRQGVRAVICGSPNAGKSSLMNALLKESRSIVTHMPGTTRDTIEELVNIKGIPVVLVDTAGITETDHPIEKEGIRRSRLSLRRADLVLLVFDYSRKLNNNDIDIMRGVNGKEVVLVINKADLKKGLDIGMIRKFFPGQKVMLVSSLSLKGIDALEDAIKDRVWRGRAPGRDIGRVSNERQLEALRRSYEELKMAIQGHEEGLAMECAAVCARSAIERLGEVTGDTITEEALDRIFSEFCIGK